MPCSPQLTQLLFTLQVVTFTTPSLADYIVIDPAWIYTTLVGRLLSEYPLPSPYITYDENGCAPLDDVDRILATEHMSGQRTIDIAHEMGLAIKRTADLVVPIKMAGTRPDQAWKSVDELASSSVNAGRRLVSSGLAGISTAVFPLLQSYLHEFFKDDHGVEIPMWRNGLSVSLSTNGGAEAIVQASQELLSIDILVRGSADNVKGSRDLLDLLVRKVQDKTDELSPGSRIQKRFLSSRALKILSTQGSTDVEFCVAYTEESVQKALVSGGRVADVKSPFPEPVEDLLLSESEARGMTQGK